jgi:hypothetical protein
MRIIAAIVIALTSVATASPGPNENTGRYRYGQPDSEHHAPRHGEWIPLATATSDDHGTEYVMVGRDAGRFSKIRIVADDGRVEVARIKVDFADGTHKTYQVNRVIGKHRDSSVDIDLRTEKEIDDVAVTTWKNNGTYSVFGL